MSYSHKITVNPTNIVGLDSNLAKLSIAERYAEGIVNILNSYYGAEYNAEIVPTEVWGHEFGNSLKFKGDISKERLEFLKAFCPYITFRENFYWEPMLSA
jgi:hypothetical protein